MSQKSVWVFLLLGYFTLLFADPIADRWDDLSTDQPWIDVEVALLDSGNVQYERQINRWMRGEWTAVVQVADGDGWRGICSRSGYYTYRPAMSGVTYLDFAYFTGGCAQPDGRHRVCVDYVMRDRRGKQRDFGPFCATSKEDAQ